MILSVWVYDSISLSLALLWIRNSHSSQSLGESRIMVVLRARDIGTVVDVILIAVSEAIGQKRRARIRNECYFAENNSGLITFK